MGRTPLVILVGGIALSWAVACRLPSASMVQATLAVVAAGAAFVLGVLSMRSGTRWMASAAVACTGALLVTPTPASAWLHVPAVVVVLPALLYMHLLFPPHATQVPWLAGEPHGLLRHTVRLAPWILLAGLAATAPWLARWILPDRIGMSTEVQGVAGPLLLAIALALAAVAVALALRRPHREPAPLGEGDP